MQMFAEYFHVKTNLQNKGKPIGLATFETKSSDVAVADFLIGSTRFSDHSPAPATSAIDVIVIPPLLYKFAS